MMKHKISMTLIFTITSLLLGVFPSLAGEWQKTEDDQWQYIQDNGEPAVGWLELDGKRYYLDENGCRKCEYWQKDDGAWYYLDTNGVMIHDTTMDIDGVSYTFDSNGVLAEPTR